MRALQKRELEPSAATIGVVFSHIDLRGFSEWNNYSAATTSPGESFDLQILCSVGTDWGLGQTNLEFLLQCLAYHAPQVGRGKCPTDRRADPRSKCRLRASEQHEIIVCFDRSMHDGYSLRFHGPNPMYDEPYWREARELVIPIRLQPGADYAIDLDDAGHLSFVDQKGFALLPTRWQFSTATD